MKCLYCSQRNTDTPINTNSSTSPTYQKPNVQLQTTPSRLYQKKISKRKTHVQQFSRALHKCSTFIVRSLQNAKIKACLIWEGSRFAKFGEIPRDNETMPILAGISEIRGLQRCCVRLPFFAQIQPISADLFPPFLFFSLCFLFQPTFSENMPKNQQLIIRSSELHLFRVMNQKEMPSQLSTARAPPAQPPAQGRRGPGSPRAGRRRWALRAPG